MSKSGIWIALGLTVLFELITCALRFGLCLSSREVVAPIIGVRIHHGYIGALLLLVCLVPFRGRAGVACLGAALVLSDLVHHFAVLPLTIGTMD